ncbi:MAG: tyrosine-type recombinase/integrase [Cupriavidus sp.]|uniref:phage integrase family protein n=1 Tax=Cupriavidus sp. TaxID=1873897 RepID=UPI0025BF41F3|nr:phage integrase family protein [Cupriavidus sp.]MCA3194060.1 tyrosine-type recombinase/integrase [Cupriavidus sp.]MCA3200300.1 tyrosine-type recombinase/integrase [Cupriavidus sp.]
MASPRLPHITRPRLHRGHFAFLRGVIEGLSPKTLWERYLSDQGEFTGPVMHRMTGWIRNELAATAARGGKFGRAHLLRLDLSPRAASALPALDAFVAMAGLQDFSEAEQLAAYAARYGTALAQDKRRVRLLHRQLFAIHTLEAQAAQPVGLQDGCEAWFIDSLASRLALGGVTTLAELHARMSVRPHWWHDLPGIGVGKARSLERFVAAHATTLGALPAWVADEGAAARAATIPPPTFAVASPLVPLERFLLPDALSGRSGRFRADPAQCHLAATDDREAVFAWLAAKGPVPGEGGRFTHTQLAYRKEAERFLLWVTLERRCALSSATVEDCIAYRDFLLDPPVHWCGPRAIPRWQAGWRPLEGPLSPRSCAYAMSVLGNLFGFLVHQGYLAGNPWRAVAVPRRLPRGPDIGRGLTSAQWAWVHEALGRLPAGLGSQRLQVALPLLHDTGLRLAELLAATTDDLRWESWAGEGGQRAMGWWLTVSGKGGKLREVPVPPGWVDALEDYLAARGYGGGVQRHQGVPLLGTARVGADDAGVSEAGVSGSAFHRQLKRFLAACAEQLAPTDAAAAARLRQASAHWMRHTHISHALDAGVPVEVVQQNVGHASLDTTSRYVRTEQARRQALMQKLWQP